VYTADDARSKSEDDLDARIRSAVISNAGATRSTHMRVYCDDWFKDTIKEELEKRGFKNVDVPDIVIKGDVYFEW